MNLVGRSGIFFMTIFIVGMIAFKTNSVLKEEGQKAFLDRFSTLVDLNEGKWKINAKPQIIPA